ncbi:MAG: DUF2231 domain-containing protein [Phycisphaerales bacterium]
MLECSLFAPTLADLDLAGFLRFVGRTHPIVVHFPIALLTVAALLEIIRILQRRTAVAPSAGACLVFAALGSIHAVVAGLLNDQHEPHGEGAAELIGLHKWVGIAAGVISILALLLYARARVPAATTMRRTAYAACVIASAPLVGLAGHLGGSIVYGEDYLFEPFRRKPPAPLTLGPGTAPNAAPGGDLFLRTVWPILEARCVECHGEAKVKGNLRLDRTNAWFIPTEGPARITAGRPDESELLRRVLLPEDDDEHMPTKGPPLTQAEAAAIRAWIEAGAGTGG